MIIKDAKAARRHALRLLYEAYMADPLEMLTPEDFLNRGELDRHGLAVTMHYLRDDGLAEVLLGYRPPLFVSARITPRGIDLVENRHEFDRRFPPSIAPGDESLSAVPGLVEQLVLEADLCALERPVRVALQRDVQYLRSELARPRSEWRADVIERVLNWIVAAADGQPEQFPSLPNLREILLQRASAPEER